ncbi:MAG: hypothetical protein JXA25_14780 [Anaerolineales bacterium]|nr:hypothetical protein [Anaerolineales bacterium]
MDQELVLLHQKMDLLTEKFELQCKQQQEMIELRQDLIPIANHFFKLTIDELAEIGQDFQLEDLLFLVKRLLRNTRSLVNMMEKFEAGIGFVEEVNVLGREVFNQVVETLDRMEREGYFTAMANLGYVADQAVHQVSPEQIRVLGDRMGALAEMLEQVTRPETLALAGRALTAVQPGVDTDEKPPGLFILMKMMFHRDFRTGLSRLIRMVMALGSENGGAGK